MRKYLVSVLALFIAVASFSQPVSELFKQAREYYRDEEYDSALFLYGKIYRQGKDGDPLLSKAYYNMADTYMQMEEYEKAKAIFEDILLGDFDEMEAGGRGEGIMAEPYALYKNNSCKRLGEIALNQREYNAALRYTQRFDKEYPYQHFCGNEIMANAIYVAYSYGRCYEGLGKRQKAIDIILPQAQYTGYSDNGYLVDFLTDSLIKKHYNPSQIRSELDNAVAAIASKTIKRWGRKYEYHYTRIFGMEIELFAIAEDWQYNLEVFKLEGNEYYKYYFKKSRFYKNLDKIAACGESTDAMVLH